MEDSAIERRIIHVDMDAFYASVEQRDNPELRGKPVAVGGSSRRGVVAAASYEARQYGVRSAMPSVTAARKCPQLVFVRPRFDVYKAVSHEIREIFREFTSLVEPLSLDEAYLDVTEAVSAGQSATAIANAIRQKIFSKTELTASAGVSFNKFLAKVASDFNKPNGITVVRPDQVDTFVGRLPIDRFFGVGRVTARKFKKMGVETGADLRRLGHDDLTRRFGKLGPYFFNLARGIDNRRVRTHRKRKSVGAERTYFEDSNDPAELRRRLAEVIDRLWPRIEKAECRWRTVTVKIKYHDFVQSTRSRSTTEPNVDLESLQQCANDLLQTPCLPQRPVRLLGVSVSNLYMPGDELPSPPKRSPQLNLEL